MSKWLGKYSLYQFRMHINFMRAQRALYLRCSHCSLYTHWFEPFKIHSNERIRTQSEKNCCLKSGKNRFGFFTLFLSQCFFGVFLIRIPNGVRALQWMSVRKMHFLSDVFLLRCLLPFISIIYLESLISLYIALCTNRKKTRNKTVNRTIEKKKLILF